MLAGLHPMAGWGMRQQLQTMIWYKRLNFQAEGTESHAPGWQLLLGVLVGHVCEGYLAGVSKHVHTRLPRLEGIG